MLTLHRDGSVPQPCFVVEQRNPGGIVVVSWTHGTGPKCSHRTRLATLAVAAGPDPSTCVWSLSVNGQVASSGCPFVPLVSLASPGSLVRSRCSVPPNRHPEPAALFSPLIDGARFPCFAHLSHIPPADGSGCDGGRCGLWFRSTTVWTGADPAEAAACTGHAAPVPVRDGDSPRVPVQVDLVPTRSPDPLLCERRARSELPAVARGHPGRVAKTHFPVSVGGGTDEGGPHGRGGPPPAGGCEAA